MLKHKLARTRLRRAGARRPPRTRPSSRNRPAVAQPGCSGRPSETCAEGRRRAPRSSLAGGMSASTAACRWPNRSAGIVGSAAPKSPGRPALGREGLRRRSSAGGARPAPHRAAFRHIGGRISAARDKHSVDSGGRLMARMPGHIAAPEHAGAPGIGLGWARRIGPGLETDRWLTPCCATESKPN